MPFKSKAQMRKFAAMVKKGEMAQAVFDRWLRETDMSTLQEKADNKYPASRRGKYKPRIKNT